MRGLMLRAVPVCFVVFASGCFLMPRTPNPYADPSSQPTRAYWQKVNSILAEKPTSGELLALVGLVRKQTDALRELPTEEVDADLVAAVNNVIKCEDEVLRRAEMANNDPGVLKSSRDLAVVFADANRAAAEAKKRVKALQPTLNTRHGGGFSVTGG